MKFCLAGPTGKGTRQYLRQAALVMALFSLSPGCAVTGIPPSTPIPIDVQSTTPSPATTLVRAQDGMRMVYVPKGSFRMGSDYLATADARALCRKYIGQDALAACKVDNFRDESPAHYVSLGAFWIDKTEMTNGQYQRCELAGRCKPPAQSGSHYRASYYGTAEYADYPVVFVTRAQASAYCEWAGGRLPTEAEWEYAARGPRAAVFPWGDAFDGTRLNYCDLACDAGPNDATIDDGYSDTAPVGSFPSGASWVGALDMAGNVREWVADWYGPYASAAQIDPGGPLNGDLVVPRGGSWIDNPSIIRSANRGGNTPDYYRDYYGFRCVVRQR